MELHFLNVLMSLVDELSHWDWSSPFHLALTAYFFLTWVVEHYLLVKKSALSAAPIGLLFFGVVACEVGTLFVGGDNQALNVVEAILFAAGFGCVAGICSNIFWQLFKRRDPNEENDRWSVIDKVKKQQEEKAKRELEGRKK